MLGMNGFEYLRQYPEAARIFDDAMTNMSELFGPGIAAAYDFGAWGSVMDVGGGNGMLLAALLRGHPGLGGVLADLPQVLARAQQHSFLNRDLETRSAFQPCDFFREVPSGCRAYVMKNVIIDWDDERAHAILVNCRRAVPADGVLLLVDFAIADGDPASLEKLADVTMLVLTGGKVRTVREYNDLLADADFRLTRVIPVADLKILEAIPARSRREATRTGLSSRALCVIGIPASDVLLRHIAGMNDYTIPEACRVTGADSVSAFDLRSWIEVSYAERIDGKQAIIAGVPAGRMIWILRMIEDQNPDFLPGDGTHIVDPVRPLPPDVFLRLTAFRVGENASVLSRHAIRYPNGEEAFLGIGEVYRYSCG